MSFRRFFASILVFIFILVAVPTFVVFGLSRTFLDANFYADNVVAPTYELLMNAVAYNIFTKDPIVQKHFKEEDIRKIVKESLPVDIFQTSMKNFVQDLEAVKTDPGHALKFDLKAYRTGLVKIAQRLAIHLFQSLPTCQKDELPQFNEEGIATCVPKDINYDVVAGPLSKQFEGAVFNAVPDSVDLSLARDQNGSTFTMILGMADNARFYAIATLMVLIVLILFVAYTPFALIVRYEGMAFLLSGFAGFLMSFALGEVPSWLVQKYAANNTNVVKMLGGETALTNSFQQIFGSFTAEVQKIAFVFLALGAILLFLYFTILKKHRNDTTYDS